MKLSCWLAQYNASDKTLRLGQHFCNTYIKNYWTELYYECDDDKALEMITQYLIELHYYPNMPHKCGECF